MRAESECAERDIVGGFIGDRRSEVKGEKGVAIGRPDDRCSGWNAKDIVGAGLAPAPIPPIEHRDEPMS
jgi:hypothetical protein